MFHKEKANIEILNVKTVSKQLKFLNQEQRFSMQLEQELSTINHCLQSNSAQNMICLYVWNKIEMNDDRFESRINHFAERFSKEWCGTENKLIWGIVFRVACILLYAISNVHTSPEPNAKKSVGL